MLNSSEDLSFWNRSTYPFLPPPRGSGQIDDLKLKAVDDALNDYRKNPTDGRFSALVGALTNWKLTVEDGVKRAAEDPKNTKCQGLLLAIENLNEELDKHKDPHELMDELRTANKQNLETLFRGKQLVVKPSQAAKGGLAIAIPIAAREVEGSLGKASNPINARDSGETTNAIVKELTGGDPSILGGSQNAVLNTLSKAIAILTMAKTGGTLGWTLKGLAKNAWKKYRDAEQARSSFAPGDPEAALNAVLQMLDREIQEQSLDAAAQAFSLSVQVGTAVATGGIATVFGGALNCVKEFADTLGRFFYTLYLFSRDQRETEIANKYLTNGPWDLSLLQHSPLLGCYVIACSTTSAIIAMSVDQYGKPGWEAEVKQMKEKADPLIDKAGELIRNSRYEIPALAYSKEVVKPSINKLSNLYLAKASKLKYELETKMDMGAKFKPHVPTKAEQALIKKRITGMGSHS